MNQTDLQAYLKKVGISQSLNINTDTLLLLHNAQHRRL
ncbi:arylamine N-acetyltransferase domain protein, partial [Vibrio harveyi]